MALLLCSRLSRPKIDRRLSESAALQFLQKQTYQVDAVGVESTNAPNRSRRIAEAHPVDRRGAGREPSRISNHKPLQAVHPTRLALLHMLIASRQAVAIHSLRENSLSSDLEIRNR